jgi:hypothetical protein
MDLKDLGSSVATMMVSVSVLYFALGVLDSYSGEDQARTYKIALSPSAATYIFLRH